MKSAMKIIDRRTVLRGLSGASIALPFLDIMGRAPLAQAQTDISKIGFGGQPKRFLAIFTPCGQGPDWMKVSNDAAGNLVLPPALSPLERHKTDLMFVSGIDNKSGISYLPPGMDNGHANPMCNLLTAVPAKGSLGNGISIDQAIANEVRGDTKFASLQLGVQPLGGGAMGYFSYKAPQVGLVSQGSPQKAFTDLFTNFMADPAALLKIQARRQSILDGIKGDYAAFALRMSGQDRHKVDVHLDAIREVEKQVLATGAGGGQSCTKPAAPVASGDFFATGKAQMDMLAMAFACDLTRVATLVFQGSGGNIRLPGMGRGIHDSSHQTYPYPKHSNTPTGDTERNAYTKAFATEISVYLDKLKAIKEPDGHSLLDNTIVYWCTEHGCGDHNFSWMPIMVAGSSGGYFKTGREVQFANGDTGLNWCQVGYCPGPNNVPNTGAGGPLLGAATGPFHGDLYVSFLNAMGVAATKFGDPRFIKGALAGLTA